MALDLEIVAIEDFAVPVRRRLRVLDAAFEDEAVHLARRATGEGDDAAAMRFDELTVYTRAVIVALQVRRGNELEQVAIARLVLGQKRQVIGLVVAGFLAVAR